MLADDCQKVEDAMRLMWPDWNPTAVQTKNLSEWFTKYPVQVVIDAAKKTRENGAYKTPNLGRILNVCKAHRTHFKDTPCYAVFDGTGYLHTAVVQAGLNDSESDIQGRAKAWFFNPYFDRYGNNYTLFIGEAMFRQALAKSCEIKNVPKIEFSSFKQMVSAISRKTFVPNSAVKQREVIREQANEMAVAFPDDEIPF